MKLKLLLGSLKLSRNKNTIYSFQKTTEGNNQKMQNTKAMRQNRMQETEDREQTAGLEVPAGGLNFTPQGWKTKGEFSS